MMIIINKNQNTITGSVNGKQFGVSYDEGKYFAMLELQKKADAAATTDELKAIVEEFIPLTQESYKDKVETICPYIVVDKHRNLYFLRYNDTISSQPMPASFAEKIIKSVDKGIPIDPLIKCWARFLRPVKGRPAYTPSRGKLFAEYISAPYTNDEMVAELTGKQGLSYDVAKERATTTQVAISQEGLLVVYKVSREVKHKFVKDEDQPGGVNIKDRYDYEVDDVSGLKTYKEPEFAEDRVFEPPIMGQGGDEFWCRDLAGNGKKGHVMRVGCTIELESWDQVDCNNSYAGTKGLHVGGLLYIRGYQKDETVTHNIFLDPMDIGAIVSLGTGNDGAMRVRRYFMESTFGGANRTIYHSSKFAAITDAEYAQLVKESVEAYRMKGDQLVDLLAEDSALQHI